MSGKRSKDKGRREEQAIVNAWRKRGFACERVPLSGALGGEHSGDVKLWTIFGHLIFEAKIRANGFKKIYEWLGDNDALCIRADRNQRLYVMTEDRLAKLLGEAEYGA